MTVSADEGLTGWNKCALKLTGKLSRWASIGNKILALTAHFMNPEQIGLDHGPDYCRSLRRILLRLAALIPR
jgi:hypothetical protein